MSRLFSMRPMPRSVFFCFLFFLVFSAVGFNPVAVEAVSHATLEKEYNNTKLAMTKLLNNEKRNRLREPWEDIIARFDKLYKQSTTWPNRPAALYRSGVARAELARRSFLKSDARAAIDRLLQVEKSFSRSVLADDALFEVATLQEETPLRDPKAAAETLQRMLKKYPSGDQASKAKSMLARVSGKAKQTPTKAVAAKKQTPSKAAPKKKIVLEEGLGQNLINGVNWRSKSDFVRVTVLLTRPTSWEISTQKPDAEKGTPARLILDMPDTAPAPTVRPGARVDKSPLTRVRLDVATPGKTRLLLDFSTLRRFQVTQGSSPAQIVIEASTRDDDLPDGQMLGSSMRETLQYASTTPEETIQTDLAAQLGLSIRTIVLDPGHGGNDEGTHHNSIIERDFVLDFSKRLGKLLSNRGYKIEYTRDKNVRLELDERPQIAKDKNGDLFVSIHVNAGTHPDIHGYETYYLDFASSNTASRLAALENSVGTYSLGDMEKVLADLMLGARQDESKHLAERIQFNAIQTVKEKKFAIRDNGVRSAPFLVLLGAGMPGVLVELGYATNKVEAKRLRQPAYLNALAEGIARGIDAYANDLAKGIL